jgi:hypothetical protein
MLMLEKVLNYKVSSPAEVICHSEAPASNYAMRNTAPILWR